MQPPADERAPSEILDAVESAYLESRYRTALGIGEPLGDLRGWPGVRGRILAARLAGRLGDQRLAQGLFFATYRAHPDDPLAARYHAFLVLGRRGPWHARRWLRDRGQVIDEPRRLELEAIIFGGLRDFERAHHRLDRLLDEHEETAYRRTLRAGVLRAQDRLEAALEEVDRALELSPGSDLAWLTRANLLGGLGRRDEAYAELSETAPIDESYELLWRRAELAFADGRYAQVAADLEAAEGAAALADWRLTRRLALARAEAYYLLGRHREAAELLEGIDEPFATAFRERLGELSDGAAPVRVELRDVPFIRQHHSTCAPASIASILAAYDDPIDHVELAKEICYAGTPIHLSREWAEKRGYQVRQLDVSFEAVRAAIDAGLPVYFVTAETVTSHAQVIMGYDLARHSLLIRDPSWPDVCELRAQDLEKHRWSGPLGMILVPADREELLERLELPNAAAWDARHEIALALEAHDLDRAERTVARLVEDESSEPHGTWASLELARYLGDADRAIGALDRLIERFEQVPALVLQRGEWMRGRQSRADQVAFWSQHAHLDDPSLLEGLAEELRLESREHDRAARLLRRALRLRPSSAMGHHVMGDLGVDAGADPSDVLDSYRFAVCLDLAHEHYANAYFRYAASLGREDEALALLERRVEEAGDRSAEPAKTLFAAHLDRGNPERGLAALEEVAERRPEDGQLAIALVHAHLDTGEPEGARAWLELAEQRAARLDSRASARARLARVEGRLDEAIELLDEALARFPERVDLLLNRLDVTADLRGRDAALRFLEEAYSDRPHLQALHHELCVWLRYQDDERAAQIIEERLADHPHDRWCARELALTRLRLEDHEGALEAARAAVAIAPHDAHNIATLGHVLAQTGDEEGALRELRRAVELNPDQAVAIAELDRVGEPRTRRRSARFVLELLAERGSTGAGVLEAARLSSVLPHEERTRALEAVLARVEHRPDAWESVARAQLEAGDVEAADELIRAARERFPRWFALLSLQAEIRRVAGDAEGYKQTLRELVALVPDWAAQRTRLSEALRAEGAYEEARSIVEAGLQAAPRSGPLHRESALLSWSAGRRAEAFETLLSTLRGGFADEQTFAQLSRWARELGREEEVEAILLDGEREHPTWSVFPWRRAILFADRAHYPRRIEALREVLKRSPAHASARDLLAEISVYVGDFDQALEACEWPMPTVRPVNLRGREAWILVQRGDREEGVTAMRELLEEVPDYSWGHRMLCDWLDADGDARGFLEAAERLVAELPNDGLHHVYLADAQLAMDQRAPARATLRRALALSPRDAYAARRLVGLLLDDEDLEEAAEVVERFRFALPEVEATYLTIRIAAAGERWDEAHEALRRLVASRVDRATLDSAIELLGRSRRYQDALDLLRDQLFEDDPAAGEGLGYTWARAEESREPGAALALLRQREELGPAGHAAVAYGLEELGRSLAWIRLLWVWLRHRAWLRASGAAWGAMGYCLFALGQVRLAARWLSDFSGREGIRPHMLLNLVVLAWRLRRRGLAERAAARALELPPDDTRARHRAWQIFHLALDGREVASATIEALGLPAEARERGLIPLVEALEAARALGSTASATARVKAAHPALMRAAQLARSNADLRGPYAATVDAIAAPGHLLDRWWARLAHVPTL